MPKLNVSQKTISNSEWEARVNLATFFRIIHANRWDDHIFTHLSVRVPNEPDHMIIAPFGHLFSEVTATSLIKTNLQGVPIDDKNAHVNMGAVIIHGGIYMAKPEANYVVHLHTRDNAAVSAQRFGLLSISQAAMMLHGHIAYHDYEGLAIDPAECESIAKDLGDCNVMVLRNHGSLVWGRTIEEAHQYNYNFERACSIQVAALSAGDVKNLSICSEEVARLTASQANYDPQIARLSWEAARRKVQQMSADIET